jgi:hypothetical protein
MYCLIELQIFLEYLTYACTKYVIIILQLFINADSGGNAE